MEGGEGREIEKREGVLGRKEEITERSGKMWEKLRGTGMKEGMRYGKVGGCKGERDQNGGDIGRG